MDFFDWVSQQQNANRENFKKHAKTIIACYVVFFGLLAWGLYSLNKQDEKEREQNYNYSYELACQSNAYDVAHKLLLDLKARAESAKKDAITFKQDNELIEKKVEKHLFKKDETDYDDTNKQKYESLVEEFEAKAKEYLVGLNYVYNAELRYVLVSEQDGFKTRAKLLIHEMETEMKWFNGTEMESEAKEMVENSKGLMEELILEESEDLEESEEL